MVPRLRRWRANASRGTSGSERALSGAHGSRDGRDLATLLAKWGQCDSSATCPEDANGDGRIDGFELAGPLAEWGA